MTMNEALLLAGPSPETGRAYTQQEFELRERLRLEALERRSRSLRSSPVAQTYRQLDRARSPADATARSPARSKRSGPRERRRFLRPLGRSRV